MSAKEFDPHGCMQAIDIYAVGENKFGVTNLDWSLNMFTVYVNIRIAKQMIILQCVSRIWAILTWLQFLIRRLKLIFTTAPAASKNGACFKNGHNQLKNNHLAS